MSHGCALAIVGSRIINERDAKTIIEAAIAEHGPNAVVTTNEGRGVPKVAREVSLDQGVAYIVINGKEPVWRGINTTGDDDLTIDPHGQMVVSVPGGIMERNLRVADMAGCLVRISAKGTRTYGSGWTADMAERMGKPVVRHEV